MRYTVLDLPARGVGAFTPVPTTNPTASSFGLVELEGTLGTEPMPAPAPQRDYLPNLTRTGGKDSAQGSMVAPDVTLPDVYVPFADHMGPAADTGIGMQRRRFNELPIPARDPVRLALPTQRTPAIGGRSQIAWPRAFQRFPAR